jgi:hypothetical protein
MTSLWTKLTGLFSTKTNRRPVRTSRRPIHARLGVEALEDRWLPSGSPLGSIAAPVHTAAVNSGPTGNLGPSGTGQGASKYPPTLVVTQTVTKVTAGTRVTFSIKVVSLPSTATAAQLAAAPPLATYNGMLHFTSSDKTAVFFSDALGTVKMPTDSSGAVYWFKPTDAGKHTFSVIMHTTGVQSWTATDLASALGFTTHKTTMTVNP